MRATACALFVALLSALALGGASATAEIKGALGVQLRLVQREGKWYLTD